MRIQYLLNGVPVNPVKRKDIYLEINHDQESIINQPAPHVGINNLYFAREDVNKVMTLLKQAPGITEGIPFDIKITKKGQTEIINMYIDCMEGFKRSKDGISASVKMLQSLDWLDDKVDAFTYESMYNETNVTSFVIDNVTYSSYQQYFDRKTIYIPYVISTIPNWHDAFLAIFGITYIGTELYKIGNEIKSAIAKVTSDPFQWGEIAGLVVFILFAVLLIATLIGLINQLIACLIQPVKYHAAMLMSDLLKITAVKIGLNAQSSIWDAYPFNQIAYLPEKYNPVESSPSVLNLMGFNVGGFGSKGYTSPAYAPTSLHTSQTANIQHGYFNGVGGDFLRLIKKFCNGKIIIPDQTDDLVLERRDRFPAGTPYKLPDLRQDWNGFNTEELTATILIKFQADLNEKNCIDHKDPSGNPFYPGTILQATHQQISTTDASMVCLKGLREINISAARGVAKDRLTFIEQAVKDLDAAWNSIAGIITGIVNAFIAVADIIIGLVNIIIFIWNAIIDVLHIIVDVINVIIDAVDTLPGVDIPTIDAFDNGNGKLDYISMISFLSVQNLTHNFTDRINALLLENDMVDTPKLLLVDTGRVEFQGTRRIAYLHNDNAAVINAKYLWDKFYAIDAFTGTPNNRFTKISPSLKSDSEKNKISLSLDDFKNLVSNPQFSDNFNEKVIADSIQWHIEKNGAADFSFRKAGWKADPGNQDGIKRAEEIAINLQLQISIPNGQ